MIEQNYDQGLKDPHTKWAIRFFFLFLFIGFGYVCYKAYIEYTSEVRYTVLQFYERYSDSKRDGMKISYLADGELRYANCFTMECKKIKKGEKRLGYYFIDDPTFYGILYNITVPDSVLVPEEGWKEIPEFLKPKK
ncbi:hypothetical protein MM213_11470 [Belliella sp. R4-6]|uniref:DUF4359 domain-containing protein n=1 Tax=Belliella alkalica TaxID=1730871 RepID=A0ABS9VCF6_9BACT|nr:hypothetical protein [Belliella alkalica]MCH7414109.1 hypothetical protein [Belliella alkalica]